MDRQDFLKTAGLGAAGLALAHIGWPQTPRKPNVVLILADDLGYGELGVQGCRDIPTPNTDSIAAAGVRFTDGYVSCPVCAPTRAGLMTGRYQQRFGFEANPGPAAAADPDFGLPRDQATLAERLKTLGCATGAFGKWHLGYKPGCSLSSEASTSSSASPAGRMPTCPASGPTRSSAAPRSCRSPSTSPTPSVERPLPSSKPTASSPSSSTCPSTPSTRRCRHWRSTCSASRTSRTASAVPSRR